jgi:hypothetical protein
VVQGVSRRHPSGRAGQDTPHRLPASPVVRDRAPVRLRSYTCP